MTAKSSAGRLKAISLFSGAGGMDVGVVRAGFDVLLANDIDKAACDTYRKNHGNRIVEGPIEDILPVLGSVTNIDLVFGGPPCQGFSVAGRMDPEDPRSSLMNAFFDAVDAVKPKAFICENVKALAKLSRWEDVRRRLLERASANYLVDLVVLRASDFGVPQNRERMFIIGIRKTEAGNLTQAAFSEQLRLMLAAREAPSRTLGDVVRALGPAGSQGNSRVCRAKITYAKAPVMRKSAYAGMLFNGAGRPLDPSGVASTLPASMGGNKTPIVDEDEVFAGKPSFVAEYHAGLVGGRSPRRGKVPSRLRRLTVDECLAIQSFPSDYQLCGSQSAAYRQIGNAVPCDLAFAVASAVETILGDIRSENREISQKSEALPQELLKLLEDAAEPQKAQ